MEVSSGFSCKQDGANTIQAGKQNYVEADLFQGKYPHDKNNQSDPQYYNYIRQGRIYPFFPTVNHQSNYQHHSHPQISIHCSCLECQVAENDSCQKQQNKGCCPRFFFDQNFILPHYFNSIQCLYQTQMKNVKDKGSQNYIYNECRKILNNQTAEQTNKWFLENGLTSYVLRNEKSQLVMGLAVQILEFLEGRSEHNYLSRMIVLLGNNNVKCYEHCRCLKHFAIRDNQFAFIFACAKNKNQCDVSFYLRVRSYVINSALNRTSKFLMSATHGDEEDWFKILSQIFSNQPSTELLDMFIQHVKIHFLSHQKSNKQTFNGSQFFQISALIYEELKQKHHNFTFQNKVETGKNKSASQSRQLQRQLVHELEVQDRQLMRALSFKDENIAKLLQKKHNKMLELIKEEVEQMRRGLQEQKRKYVEMMKQKEELITESKHINESALHFIQRSTRQTEQKLIEGISKFNKKYLSSTLDVEKTKKLAKERRLIELIEKQELEAD